MNAGIQFDGNASESFRARSGIKQGCVLAPTLFVIYFVARLQHAFEENEDKIYLKTRFDGSLFSLRRLKSKRLTTKVLIRELLFADDASIATHSEIELQRLVDRLAEASDLFRLTIRVQKTGVIGQGTNSSPEITLGGESLKTVDTFVCWSFTKRRPYLWN